MSWLKGPPWQKRIQQQSEADRVKRESERHQAILSALNSISNQLKSTREQQQADNSKKEPREKWTIWITAAIGLAAFIVSIFQMMEMRRQTNTTARAWIGYQQISDSELPITIDRLETAPHLSVAGHYSIKNFGNGPAIKVISQTWVTLDEKLSFVAADVAFLCESGKKFSTGEGPARADEGSPGKMGFTLFPGQTYPGLLEWGGDDPQPDLKWLHLMGCVAYLDQFNESHWTRFVVIVGDGKNPVNINSPRKLYTLFNDTDETGEKGLRQMAEIIRRNPIFRR